MKQISHSFRFIGRLLAFALLFCLLPGFVRSPHTAWAVGEVRELNTGKPSLTLRTSDKSHPGEALVITWDKRTRFWTESPQKKKSSLKFDAGSLKPGDRVQIQFRHFTDRNLATRVIRLASH